MGIEQRAVVALFLRLSFEDFLEEKRQAGLLVTTMCTSPLSHMVVV